MSTFLLDANVLIALSVREHEHHDLASDWLAGVDRFAICPMVEGALVRFLLRMGESPATCAAVLAGVRSSPRCLFWPDDISYVDVELAALRGHRQVTDSYLATLARGKEARLVTFDRALAGAYSDCTLLILRVVP